MRLLIIVRHGDYDENLRLTDYGRSQMLELAEALKPYVVGTKRLLSSNTDRARESAEVLAKAIDTPMELHEVLWSQKTHPENLPAALELIRANKDVDVLLLMTHLEYTGKIPRHFFREELGTDLPWNVFVNIEKGEAGIIDCEEKIYFEVS